jgi:RNA polymerase subunit RPABC4/transcription elongation factor Spt4
MGGKGCPHCGNIVSEEAPSCGCGFAFSGEGFEVQGASSARSLSDQALRKARKPPTKRPERPKKPQAGKRAKETEMVKTPSTGSTATRLDPSRLVDCPFCSARISKRAHECPKCGREPFLDCQICGANIIAGSAVCPECGDPDPFNP